VPYLSAASLWGFAIFTLVRFLCRALCSGHSVQLFSSEVAQSVLDFHAVCKAKQVKCWDVVGMANDATTQLVITTTT
jgi:hypothetical protein